MTRFLPLLLGLAACGLEPGPWTVVGASPDDEVAALAIVDAVKLRVGPSPLDYGGTITLSPSVDQACGCRAPPCYFSGCLAHSGVIVLWPHPMHPGCWDLARCSALAHELCHVAQGYRTTEASADECARAVAEENSGLRTETYVM